MSTFAQITRYYRDVRDFKDYFIKNCLVEKKYEAYKVWAHWLIRSLCEKDDTYHIIPNQKIAEDVDIIDHLKSKGSNAKLVHEFYNQVVCRGLNLYNKYNQMKTDLFSNIDTIKLLSQRIDYSVIFEDGMCYHLYKLADTYIKHNELKHQKLLKLYKGGLEYRNFYMFEVGFNYYILDGHSLQWCIPPKVFEVLSSQLNVKTELFASPTNVNLPLYCSLFVVDKMFGALDNFFNLDSQQVLEGTFEINPPFIDKLFLRSSEIIIKFLEQSQKSGRDLMFIYIMPGWLDSKGYQLLTKCQYLIDEIIFDANTHSYYQSSNDRMIEANFESHVMIVGTEASRVRWTAKIRSEIVKAFSSQQDSPR
jgi:hypothetical protein